MKTVSIVLVVFLLALCVLSSQAASTCESECIDKYGSQKYFQVACAERCSRELADIKEEEIAQALLVKLRSHAIATSTLDDTESDSMFVKSLFNWLQEKLGGKKKNNTKKTTESDKKNKDTSSEEESDINLSRFKPLVQKVIKHVRKTGDNQELSDLAAVRLLINKFKELAKKIFKPSNKNKEETETQSDAVLIREMIEKLKNKFGKKKQQQQKKGKSSDDADKEESDYSAYRVSADAEAERIGDRIKQLFAKIQSKINVKLQNKKSSSALFKTESDSEFLIGNIITKLKQVLKKEKQQTQSDLRLYNPDWNKSLKIEKYTTKSDARPAQNMNRFA